MLSGWSPPSPLDTKSTWVGRGEALVEHLIEPLEERRRERQTESFGGLEVDDEGMPVHLLDGQCSRERALCVSTSSH